MNIYINQKRQIFLIQVGPATMRRGPREGDLPARSLTPALVALSTPWT